jgi:hypothetical protein
MKVLEIAKKHYGEDDITYAKILHNFFIIFELLGDYEKAKDGYLKVLEIIEKN